MCFSPLATPHGLDFDLDVVDHEAAMPTSTVATKVVPDPELVVAVAGNTRVVRVDDVVDLSGVAAEREQVVRRLHAPAAGDVVVTQSEGAHAPPKVRSPSKLPAFSLVRAETWLQPAGCRQNLALWGRVPDSWPRPAQTARTGQSVSSRKMQQDLGYAVSANSLTA